LDLALGIDSHVYDESKGDEANNIDEGPPLIVKLHDAHRCAHMISNFILDNPQDFEKLKGDEYSKVFEQGVCHIAAELPFTLKKYILRQKKELWKFKDFTMQKYNLQQNPLKRNQNPLKIS
jgi:hypothetical protein